MSLRLSLAAVLGTIACGPDVAPTPADSETESGSDAAGEPGTAGSTSIEPTTESGETEEASSSSSGDVEPPDAWCVDVHWVEERSGVAGLDVDGDGRVELWTARSDWDPIDGAFTTTFVAQALEGEQLVDVVALVRDGSFIAFADIDGDGRSDAIVEPTLDAGPHFLRGTASGELQDTPLPITGWDPADGGELIDVTADAAVDLLRVVEGTLEIHVGDGEGGFALGDELHLYDAGGGEDIAVTFDGDLVIAVSPFSDFNISVTEVIVLSVGPDGTLTEQGRTTPGGHIEVLDVTDRDGDGGSDVLVRHAVDHSEVRLSWLDDDDGSSFTEDVVLEPETIRAIADFDLDGTIDVIDELGVLWGIAGEHEPLLGDLPLDSWVDGDFDADGRADFYRHNVIWSVEPCEGTYDEPEEPEPPAEPECGNGRVEAHEECDGSADCSDECIVAAAVIWTTVHDGAGLSDCGRAIAVAPTGEIYVAGQQGTEDSGDELVVLALDVSGATLWSDTYQATLGPQSDIGTGIAVAPDGDVFVSGNVYGDLAWLRRYTPEGEIVWTEQAGSLEVEIGSANALVLDAGGLPVIVGNAEGTAWLGAYDADGSPRWDGLYDDDGLASDFTTVALDDAGNVTAFGHTDGRSLAASFDPDGTPRWNVVSAYPSHAVVAGGVAPDGRVWLVQRDEYSAPDEWVVRTLDPAGAPTGAFVISTQGLRDVLGIAFDPDGDAILVGDRDGAAWIRRVHDDGALVWERSFGEDDIIGGSTVLHDAVVDADGTIVATGCLDGDVLVRRFAP
jgi:hypothetical protein